MRARAFDELQVCGFMDVLQEPRPRPVVVPAALLDPDTGEVLVPPFVVANGLLSDAGAVLGLEEFEALCAAGRATRREAPRARVDGCFYAPPGSGPPEFTSLTVAVQYLQEYADQQNRRGDALMRQGRAREALEYYERAAAVAQRPDDYARMLLVRGLSERRRARIEGALRRVATQSAEEHVRRVRRFVWGRPRTPIFGDSAEHTTKPLEITAGA